MTFQTAVRSNHQLALWVRRASWTLPTKLQSTKSVKMSRNENPRGKPPRRPPSTASEAPFPLLQPIHPLHILCVSLEQALSPARCCSSRRALARPPSPAAQPRLLAPAASMPPPPPNARPHPGRPAPASRGERREGERLAGVLARCVNAHKPARARLWVGGCGRAWAGVGGAGIGASGR